MHSGGRSGRESVNDSDTSPKYLYVSTQRANWNILRILGLFPIDSKSRKSLLSNSFLITHRCCCCGSRARCGPWGLTAPITGPRWSEALMTGAGQCGVPGTGPASTQSQETSRTSQVTKSSINMTFNNPRKDYVKKCIVLSLSKDSYQGHN